MLISNYATLIVLFVNMIYSSVTTIKANKMAIAFIPIVIICNFYWGFAVKCIINCTLQFILAWKPVLHTRSKYFSPCPETDPLRYLDPPYLPPVVIQIPVYDEPFEDVIVATIEHSLKALQYYKNKGGSGNVLVCDDGYAVISETFRQNRFTWYKAHDDCVAFIARPKTPRPGKFKKASNMNYSLSISKFFRFLLQLNMVHECWDLLKSREIGVEGWGNVSIQDDAIILLLDADTVVPEEIIYQTIITEFSNSEVGYVQHFMKALSEQNTSLWLRMISDATEKIYKYGIAYGTAMGDMVPIVGHNVFIRFSALEQIANVQKIDCMNCDDASSTDTPRTQITHYKYWSTDTVSEDFDVFIRFADKGVQGVYANYYNVPLFEEGISLTYIDELKKYTKFCYGAFEMMYNPIRYWFTKGIFNRLFIQLLASPKIPTHSKLSIIYYMVTYHALAAAWFWLIVESVMVIKARYLYEMYFINCVDITVICIVSFVGLPTLGETLVSYRHKGFCEAVNTFSLQLGWVLPMSILIVSSMCHMSFSAIVYFLDMRIGWCATVKGNNKQTLLDVLQYFWKTYLCVVMLLTTFLYFGSTQLTFADQWGAVWVAGCTLMAPILFHFMT